MRNYWLDLFTGTTLSLLIINSAMSAVWQSDGSAQDIQCIHDTQARDGDTIMIPAGRFNWTQRVDIAKGITLKGQNVISNAGTTNASSDDATVVLDSTPRDLPQSEAGLLRIDAAPGKSYRLSGISFGVGIDASSNATYNFAVTGGSATAPADSVRIDNCGFNKLYGRILGLTGWVYGVIDHCILKTRGGNTGIHINQASYAGKLNGNGSWSDYPYFGTGKFFFIETNTIIGNGLGILDSYEGARWVARYNYIINGYPSGHGTEGGLQRGQRINELYNNTFDNNIRPSAPGQRSGTVLFHNNTFKGAAGAAYGLSDFRVGPARAFPLWATADGTSPWDLNDGGSNNAVEGPGHLFESGSASADGTQTGGTGTMTDSAKNWTPNQWKGYSIRNMTCSQCGYNTTPPSDTESMASYITGNDAHTISYYYYAARDTNAHLIFKSGDQYEIHRVKVMMDQNGRGKTDPIKNISGKPVLESTNQPGWPHSAAEPCFSWNNAYASGAIVGFNTKDETSGKPVVKLGVDYFNLGNGFSTTPQQVKDAYKAPVNGVDYTGPFQYPHPLATGAATPTPPPGTPTATGL